MSINLLNYVLSTELAAFFFIFCRVGSALFVLPGISEAYIPPRIRLIFALLLSMVLTPLLIKQVPPAPGSVLMMAVLVGKEITIGLFFGLLVRALISATHVAGNVIASQSSLAVGAIFDPNSGATSPVISNILGLAALTLLFVLDFHHLVLAALVKSYDVFAVGDALATNDMAQLVMRWTSDAFAIGVLMAAPYIVYSLIFYLLGGLLARLMPNFQVFFMFISPQIMIALLMFFLLLPTILQLYNGFFEDRLRSLVTGI